jgi:hypothetical protein
MFVENEQPYLIMPDTEDVLLLFILLNQVILQYLDFTECIPAYSELIIFPVTHYLLIVKMTSHSCISR